MRISFIEIRSFRNGMSRENDGIGGRRDGMGIGNHGIGLSRDGGQSHTQQRETAAPSVWSGARRAGHRAMRHAHGRLLALTEQTSVNRLRADETGPPGALMTDTVKWRGKQIVGGSAAVDVANKPGPTPERPVARASAVRPARSTARSPSKCAVRYLTQFGQRYSSSMCSSRGAGGTLHTRPARCSS